VSRETETRAQLRALLDQFGGATALKTALQDGEIDGSIFWSHRERHGCVLGTVLASRGAEDPAAAACALRGFDTLESWAQRISPGDQPFEASDKDSGSYRAAMLVRWIDEWEAERVVA